MRGSLSVADQWPIVTAETSPHGGPSENSEGEFHYLSKRIDARHRQFVAPGPVAASTRPAPEHSPPDGSTVYRRRSRPVRTNARHPPGSMNHMPKPLRKAIEQRPTLKRSVMLAGHRTSVSVEDGFWEALKELAQRNGQTISNFVSEIDKGRGDVHLSSAIRLTVLAEARAGRLPLGGK